MCFERLNSCDTNPSGGPVCEKHVPVLLDNLSWVRAFDPRKQFGKQLAQNWNHLHKCPTKHNLWHFYSVHPFLNHATTIGASRKARNLEGCFQLAIVLWMMLLLWNSLSSPFYAGFSKLKSTAVTKSRCSCARVLWARRLLWQHPWHSSSRSGWGWWQPPEKAIIRIQFLDLFFQTWFWNPGTPGNPEDKNTRFLFFNFFDFWKLFRFFG